jgi:hypothetical protein
MLLRAKQIAYLTGYSETQARRFITKIKEINKLNYDEPMVSVEFFCNYFQVSLEYAEKKLKVKN